MGCQVSTCDGLGCHVNTHTLGTRIDPYNTPVDAIKSSGVATPLKPTSSVHVSNRPLSGIYSEVSDVMKTPPTPTRPQVTQDDPYEEVEYDNVSHNVVSATVELVAPFELLY